MLRQQNVKHLLNPVALAISSLMVAHFFANFAADKVQMVVLVTVGIFIDVVAQYILALSKLRWKQRHFIGAIFLFSQYLIYILVFAIPASIGYCAGEFTNQAQVETKQAYLEKVSKVRLDQIATELRVLNLQLEWEAKSGYGSKSQTILDRIDQLAAEQKSLQKSFIPSSGQVSPSSGRVSQTLSRVYRLPETVLLQLLFSIATWMVYLTLILTSWELEKTEVKQEKATVATSESLEKFAAVVPPGSEKFAEKYESSGEVAPKFVTAPELSKVTKISGKQKVAKGYRKSLNQGPVADLHAETSDELLNFVAAAIRDSGSLNSVQKVAAQTGLPVAKCMEYRASLDEIQIDGKPIISKGRGASVSNFPKEVVLNYLSDRMEKRFQEVQPG